MKTSRTNEHKLEIKWSPMVIVSVLLHLAFFLTLFLVPESFSMRMSLGSVVYEVDLVEMPGGAPARKSTNAKQKGEVNAAIPKETKARRIQGETRRQEKPLVPAKKHEKNLAPVKPTLQKPAVAKKAQASSRPKEKLHENASLAGLPSLDPAPGMIDTGTGTQVEDAGAPIQQSSGGSLTTASLLPAKDREAIPIYRSDPPPEYPAVARRRGYEGTVVVEVLVSKEGGVQDFRLFQSSGYAVLDRAAKAAIKNWLFEPARAGDEKIEMWVKVPVRFQLK